MWKKTTNMCANLHHVHKCDKIIDTQLETCIKIRDVAKKKRENVGILKKKQGGGLPESHFHIFTVFNMGDLPKINGKIGKNSQTGGMGGVPDLGKIPTFSRFFLADVPYHHC